MTDDVERELRASYSDAAAAWADGPSRLYGLLADALVECVAAEIGGALVLDLGAGTGVASRSLRRAGARVVAADVAYGMLAHAAASRPPAVIADAAALAFRPAAFDFVVGAFVLNHVPDLVASLAEVARVLRPGGAVVASTFSSTRRHPAKDAISAVVERAGYVATAWFETFRAEREPLSGSVEALRDAAVRAGFTNASAEELDVDISSVGADGLADYRLGMAHLRPFVDALGDSRRAEVRRDAISAASPYVSVPMPMLALVARVQG